jgi:hypothetical protein
MARSTTQQRGPAAHEPGLDGTPAETPFLTVSEAALVCRRHRNTIRRRLDAGAFPNARRAFGDGAWLIPVTDLEAAGFQLRRPSAPPTVSAEDLAQQRIAHLEREMAILRERLTAAQSLADERQGRVEDFRTAMRILESAGLTGEAKGLASTEAAERLAQVEQAMHGLLYYLQDVLGNPKQIEAPRRRWPWRRKR